MFLFDVVAPAHGGKTRARGFAAGAALDAFLLGITAGLHNSLH